jgi:hypothetical protein
MKMSLNISSSYTASMVRKNTLDFASFVFVYLLRAAIIKVVKGSYIKLTISLVWEKELIGHYVFLAGKTTNWSTLIGKKYYVLPLGVALVDHICSKAGIKSRTQKSLLTIGTIARGLSTRLRYVLNLISVSLASVFTRRIPFGSTKTRRYRDHAHPGDANMYNSKACYRPRLGPSAKRLARKPKTRNAKRIEFSEMLERDCKLEDDRLVPT